MRLISMFLLVFVLFVQGCGIKPCQPIIKTEYVEVKVPVTYKLKRPPRPKIGSQPSPVYLEELTSYIVVLEATIDGTSK